MITERGKRYFVSNWSECNCHLHTAMYNAMIRLSNAFVTKAIGVVDRDYYSGLIKAVVVYDNVTGNEIKQMEALIHVFFKEEYYKVYHRVPTDRLDTKVIRYDELEQYGYSDCDIKYCFMWNNIFKKEV